MPETKKRSLFFRLVVAGFGALVGLLLLFGVFSYLNSIGIRTTALAFLIVIVGLVSLSQAASTGYGPSVILILVGLVLFADSAHLFGTFNAHWPWVALLGLLALVLLLPSGQKSGG